MKGRHLFWIPLICSVVGAIVYGSHQKKGPVAVLDGSVVASASVKTEPTESFDCLLTVPPSVRMGRGVPAYFRLTNRSPHVLFVLKWYTPLEGMFGDIFQITRDGVELPYSGIMEKRGNPVATEYVLIAVGASVEAQVDLSQGYDFSKPGRYHIVFRGKLKDVATKEGEVPRPLGQHRAMLVKCPAVETEVVPL